MIRDIVSQHFDEWSTDQIAYCSCEEDEREICLVFSCGLAVVQDDRADRRHNAAIECKYQCVGGEVYVP